MTRVPYNIIPNIFRGNTAMIIPPHCNSIIFINQGTTIATVNGVVLNPGTPGVSNGESFQFGGNLGEEYNGRVDINFPTGAGNVLAVQKIYLIQL